MDSIMIEKPKHIEFDELLKSTTEAVSPTVSPHHLETNCDTLSSGDDGASHAIKKTINSFSDSDTGNDHFGKDISEPESDDDCSFKKSGCNKFRARIMLGNDSDSDSNKPKVLKNKEQQKRMKTKRNKIKEQFKNLLKSRKKENSDKNNDILQNKETDSCSDEEMSSIQKIKQNIMERTTFIPTLCDPDTSDEEDKQPQRKLSQMKGRKSVKRTSPKPMKISAKQAMENMHKIKSESNRMLREKEVSLPYHRPKTLTLKDIMSRRKPALSADGKVLPIRMNEEQLKEYALLLEQRQKEMIELCKSDTDDENDIENPLSNIENSNSINHDSVGLVDENVLNLNKFIDTDKEKDDLSEINMNNDQSSSNLDENNLLKNNALITVHPVANVESNFLVNTNDKEDQNNCDVTLQVEMNEERLHHLKSATNENSLVNCEHITNQTESKDNFECSINKSNEQKETLHVYNTAVNYSEQTNISSEADSQLIHLHYDSEKIEIIEAASIDPKKFTTNHLQNSDKHEDMVNNELQDNGRKNVVFSDDDLNFEDIDKIIENAENDTQNNEPFPHSLTKDLRPLNGQPKLTGAPGTLIDLEESECSTIKLTGIELLKERFTYFARIKTPEELEREKERKLKPGSLHLKLKQDLEEQIAEQRSLEWAKRLNEMKQQQLEMNAMRGEESDAEDDLEKIEAKLTVEENVIDGEATSSSEEEIEDDIILKNKPRVKNTMIDDEAEESDCDEVSIKGRDDDLEDRNEDSEDDSSNSSSEEDSDNSSVDEEVTTLKKGRILKAFEDSDDEELNNKETFNIEGKTWSSLDVNKEITYENIVTESETYTQDDEIQLAQRYKSDELLSSPQGSKNANPNDSSDNDVSNDNILDKGKELGVFSICNTKHNKDCLQSLEKLSNITDTQSFVNDNLLPTTDGTVVSFSQNMISSQISIQPSQSQPIGDDILALCTGKFYDNVFVSQSDQNFTMSQDSLDCDSQVLSLEKADGKSPELNKNSTYETDAKESDVASEDNIVTTQNMDIIETNRSTNNKNVEKDMVENINDVIDKEYLKDLTGPKNMTETTYLMSNKNENHVQTQSAENEKSKLEDCNIYKSILEELNDPQFDTRKPEKLFISNTKTDQIKKKFVIDSDDEDVDKDDGYSEKKKKLKKKKLKKRALQISDDEEEIEDEQEEYVSDLEDDVCGVVEYDSEENEIQVNIEQPKKKKRKATEFFEQEAELTSEDEWIGSGDEDEAGLDQMEREEGDDEKFNQGQLQRELEQIHMRDVLDQDKREVRIIQELLFEDGDLGEGSRQRKFRWKNAEGEEDTDVRNDDITNTQEEEFESEEQWRKQRHEREVFLRQMKNEKEENSSLNISISRTSIIKANLISKTMSSLLMEASGTNVETIDKSNVPDKKISTDITSPKKAFTIFQQNYHGSLLTRGRGALARLAALATPLAVDEAAPKLISLPTNGKRNFVFAALSQPETKVNKRKAETTSDTPKLVKKMKIEEKQKHFKSRLLDHFKL